jgi:membrane protein YdbS with pleckstrin-like domain
VAVLKRYYRRSLINDERLVKVLHQHWRVVAIPILLSTFVVVLPIVILLTIFAYTWGKVILYLVLAGGLIAWVVYALPPLSRWYATSYAITTRKVMFREGLLDSSQRQIELVRVARTTVHQRGWDKLLRSGTIDLGDDHVLECIPQVARIDRLLNQLAATQTKKLTEQIQILNAMGYRV